MTLLSQVRGARCVSVSPVSQGETVTQRVPLSRPGNSTVGGTGPEEVLGARCCGNSPASGLLILVRPRGEASSWSCPVDAAGEWRQQGVQWSGGRWAACDGKEPPDGSLAPVVTWLLGNRRCGNYEDCSGKRIPVASCILQRSSPVA